MENHPLFPVVARVAAVREHLIKSHDVENSELLFEEVRSVVNSTVKDYVDWKEIHPNHDLKMYDDLLESSLVLLINQIQEYLQILRNTHADFDEIMRKLDSKIIQ